ncbi:hypothetical protein [Roseateles sp.]|uniref:hypothetical protein n=1 Tax=Roseateles sp. TaxID=1971397 RepID=UPI002F405060
MTNESPDDSAPDAIDIARLAELVERRIANSASPTPVSVALPANGYEDAAAVLAWFEPQSLTPLGTIPSDEKTRKDLMDQLLLASTPITDAEGIRRWALRPTRRVARLRALRQTGTVRHALAANPDRPAEATQTALTFGLSGKEIPIRNASLLDLKAFLEVANWLQAAGIIGISPTTVEISSWIDWRTLLQPFDHIAGDNFRGRTSELNQLRSFADVVQPQTLADSGRRFVDLVGTVSQTYLLRRSPKVALVISGPGGVGKSTLVARFLLEHAQAHEVDRFPFAYLDFDRPDLVADEPLTLLTETVRQLGIEYPEVRGKCELLRQGWLLQLAERDARSGATPAPLERIRVAAVRDAVQVIRGLAGGTRPILLVLDTFEEVQYRGEHAVNEIWRLLTELRAQIPALRIVIAGRSEVEQPSIVSMTLQTFDEPSAVGYLRAKGVESEPLAKRIFRLFGGSPLTLKLAADVAKLEQGSSALESIDLNEGFGKRLSNEYVQRQLYHRVLKHIHDPEVRKLAHPGLLLRRITPDSIQTVLAEPCDVVVRDIGDAERLFQELRREVSLVRMETDGSLRHRQDLRSLMLDALHRDDPKKARTIHARAVAFYETMDGDTERAEEIYHRLWLDDPLEQIAARWKRGIRSGLQGAAAEFDPRRRAFLAAMLDVPVDAEARRASRLEDWEVIASRQARDLLAGGDPQSALDVLAERVERTIGSPALILQARAWLALGRHDEAVSHLDGAFARAHSAPNMEAATRIALALGEVIIQAGASKYGKIALARLEWVNQSATKSIDRIASRAMFAFVTEMLGQEELFRSNEHELNQLVVGLSASTLARSRTTAYWAGAAPGIFVDTRLLAVTRAVGVPRASDARMRHLGFSLARADISHSQQNGLEPGAFARHSAVPLVGSITDSWSAYVVEATSAQLKSCVLEALALGPLDGARAAIESALQGVMAEEVGVGELTFRRDSLVSSRDATVVPEVVPSEHRMALVDAIESTCTLEELRAILRRRLDRVIDAYSLTATLRDTALVIVNAAADGQWILHLAAALVDAKPDSHQMAAAASALGLSTLTGDASLVDALQQEIGRTSDFFLRSDWMQRLAQIDRATCIVEIDGVPHGTGFLVAADLILTARRIVVNANGELRRPISFRFDYRASKSGVAISNGSVFPCLAEVPMRMGSQFPPFVLLRADAAPGAQPVGGAVTESSAGIRRWLQIPSVRISQDMPLVICSFARGLALRMSVGVVESIDPLTYRIDTPSGSTGAPCFDARTLRLVAMNLTRTADPTIRAGVRIDKIASHARILADESNLVDPTW